MTDRPARIALTALAVTMLAIAAVYLLVRPKSEPAPMPDDPIAIARRLARHPADWEAASALTERALDAPVPDRMALWRAARTTAMLLAPNRNAPRVAFARGIFFHWTELPPADRKAALDAIGPLLRDTGMFFRMARPLYDLTGDLGFLRRWQPGTTQSMELLISIALPNGDFADYRALRRDLVAREFADLRRKMPRLSPAEIINALPPPPYTTDHEPLIAAVLAELHRRPLDEDPRLAPVLDALIDYATRHHLRPLDGLEIVTKIPAASDAMRLALANELGLDKRAFQIRMTMADRIQPPQIGVWQGTERDAWMLRDFRGPATVTVESVASDEVPPYVEVFVDDARVAEGEVTGTRTFAVPAAQGVHRLQVRLMNPLTRNLAGRRIRIVSVGP